MTKKVTLKLEVEFETRDEATANAAIIRLRGELAHSIQEGKMGHNMTGVIPGSVGVRIVDQRIA
jgi:hypothetical protein